MSIFLNKVGSATSNTASEIPAFDPASDRLFVVAASKVDIYSVSNKGVLAKVGELAPGFTSAAGTTISPNSVAIKNGLVAVAYDVRDTAAPNTIQKGRVSFFRAADGAFLNSVEVGFLPDMLTFTPDGTKVLVANEGEPNENFSNDPVGSVSVISINSLNLAGGTIAATVQDAGFASFNDQITQLRADGLRIVGGPTGTTTTVAQDVEPEYIAVSADGLTAAVTLQEANAIAFLDIATATITSIKPLGLKDFSLANNGFGGSNGIDASDRDVDGTSGGGGKINIVNQPIFSAYQPDAISSFVSGGNTFYVIANEGDARVRPTAGGIITGQGEGGIYNEEVRVSSGSYDLDNTVFPNEAVLKQAQNLGRLTVTNKSGDTDGDGDFDQIVAFGGRSFSILDASGNIVFDSGDQLEKLTAQFAPTLFNSEGTTSGFDSRSDNKGPEPEGVVTGVINGRTYAFVGLERVGDVIVYDVTNPTSPTFVQYINTPEDARVEGLTFVAATDSPTGNPLLITASEGSNTVGVFNVQTNFSLQILHGADFEAGVSDLDNILGFSAIVNKFKAATDLPSNVVANTLILSAGDNYIPGAFFNASSDARLNNVGGLGTSSAPVLGRGDIGILNAIGVQASALGNHEFDLGLNQVASIIRTGSGNPGTAFPYLSSNLDFSPETGAGRSFATTDFSTNPVAEASTIKGKIAESTVITVAGIDGVMGTADDQKIGIVGATTPTLPTISSSGATIVTPGNPNDFAALAAEIQKTVDLLTAQGINKIVLLSHFQQFAIESEQVAPRLKDVDIVIGGGSNTRLLDDNDVLRAGDTDQGDYPTLRVGTDGKPILVVNTDGNYKYVGRLVTEFDNDGVLLTDKLNSTINGAYATDAAGVNRVYGETVSAREKANTNVVAIVDGIRDVIASKDNVILGKTSVFLNGTRGDVRTQETNFGNLTADANLALAKKIDPTVTISIKNGGGIRDNIGAISVPAGSTDADDVETLPPQPNPLAPNKEEGDISQLDLENSLRFNNGLTLITLTAQQLRWVIEHAVAGTRPGATPGQFPQVGGISFSFDPTKQAIAFDTATGAITQEGQRIQNLVVLNEDGSLLDTVVKNGVLVGDVNRTFRTVTLNFLAGTAAQTPANALGGDRYPFPVFVKENAERAKRVDLRPETVDVNLNGVVDAAPTLDAGKFTFAATGSEQDALAEFLGDRFDDIPFNAADVRPAQDTRIQNLSVRNDGIFTTTGFTQNTPGVIEFTGSSALTQIVFNITSVNVSSTVNELVVFEIDGSGTAPNLKSLLETNRGRVISSLISNRPNGFGFNDDDDKDDDGDDNDSRTLGFSKNAKLGFAIIKNGTADDILFGKSREIIFSTTTTTLISNVTSSSFRINFEGFVVNAIASTVTKSLGGGLQDNKQGEVLDLRSLGGNVSVDFTVNREAAFNNFVGFYRVANVDGGIDVNGDGVIDFTPGQSGYARAAIENRIQSIDLSVANQGTATFNDKVLAGGSIFAPFLISNGTAAQFLSGQVSQAYFAYLGANPGNVDHIRLLGDNTFGFEDLPSGGDFDYNDIVLKVKVG
ncbi:MAG: bifunctional metallophosphatase/5'-nucleotidase [Pseudanabaena sp.]|nr:MAG: bifunctional metallophosphatase/5'-nucleotidase [Pseudanabaena sp.]